MSALSLVNSLILIWADDGWDWRATQVLFSGITLTVVLSLVALFRVMTRHRGRLVRG